MSDSRGDNVSSDIEIKNLEVIFKSKRESVRALNNINVTFEENKVTGLIGESGSGKSVLGMSILRLLPNTAQIFGNCYYNGKDLINCKNKYINSLRGREISLIPQNPSESLNPVLKIKKQLVESFVIHNKKQYKIGVKKSKDLLNRFGFEDTDEVMSKYTFQMSGGMNQRIISVLGLICRPKWVIADEPTKGLDAILRKQVYNVLKNIIDKDDISMILITHDIILAKKLCDNIIVMYKGEIVEQGKANEVINNPKHPYTKGLINSLPDRGMIPINHIIDNIEGSKTSCNFYSKCENRSKICSIEKPKDIICGENRVVRCLMYDRG